MIVENSYALLSLYGYCAEHAIQIPHDLSTVSVSNEKELEWMYPLPTHARYP